MKITRFEHQGKMAYGIIRGEDQIEVLSGSPFESPTSTGKTIPLLETRRLSPVESPPNILAIGLNYRCHASETGAALPDHPLIFMKATTSLTGSESPITLPAEAPDEVDYEAELAIVIGKRTKHITEAEAPDFILGYTCANDVSARDCQLKLDGQWARGKSFDSFCPLGPWIETELNPGNCRIESKVNGEVRQSSSTSNLIFGCHTLVSYLSRQMTLLPGTIIITGTPSGIGMAHDPPRFLRPGDVCEISIEGIGTLRNPVAAETNNPRR